MPFTVATARHMLKAADLSNGRPDALWVMSRADFGSVATDSATRDPVVSFDMQGEDPPRLLAIDIYLDDAQTEPALLLGEDVQTYLNGRARTWPAGHPTDV